jgi:PAS domain S-box-containing protein
VGWPQLFWTCFKRSDNAMALLDEQRRCVEVNGALINTLGFKRDAIVGKHAWDFVEGAPLFTEPEWRARMARGEFTGEATLRTANDGSVSVQYAAHPEMVTGRRLVLFVALETARHGRFPRRYSRTSAQRQELSAREQEIVHLVSLGKTGREIAEELHISHDTVRTHVRNAQEKVGARSRAQLVAITLADGEAAALAS